MSTFHLSANELAELEFLRFLDAQLATFCGETGDFRARKIAADFGAKHLAKLHDLETRAADPQMALSLKPAHAA